MARNGSCPRPLTRRRAAIVHNLNEEGECMAFLRAGGFEEALHVPALYRLEAQPEKALEGLPDAFVQSMVTERDRLGVWSKEPPLVKALGEDPKEQQRERGAPAGLKNLGATCYLNSLLQYLFFNLDFRESLLHLSSESDVVKALQRVFALMLAGERCTVDPSEFVTAASIDALEQADATEFSALLLDWLQQEMQSESPNFVSKLFQGEVSEVLQCLEEPSHSFERRETFFELHARLAPVAGSPQPPKKPKSKATKAAASRQPKKRKAAEGLEEKAAAVRLEELLQETAFPDELMNGANQYHCPRCDKKVDARKQTRLAALPPYLHVTVERYHYDLAKNERRKLNRSVSCPKRLALRLKAAPLPMIGEEVGEDAVLYECVGYLEHVSDSAHSGHYTATLLQEEDGEKTWWTLDDTTVTRLDWSNDAAESAPERFETATAYLVLYRRTDHRPAQSKALPAPLAEYVNSCNAAFGLERERFAGRFKIVEAFLNERRSAVHALLQALQEHSAEGGGQSSSAGTWSEKMAEAFSFVPTAWLTNFFRAEDRCLEDLECPEKTSLAPVLYGNSLLQSEEKEELLMDPLALWCGAVKLVPTAVLEGLAGRGGLDGSLFMSASGALSAGACKTAWELFLVWRREQQQIQRILQEGKVSMPEARALEAQGRGGEAVWLSLRVQNSWRRLRGGCGVLQADWVAFVSEVTRARASAEDEAVTNNCSLLAGLVCGCGLVNRPKAGFLARRADVEELLVLSEAKETRYRELWPGSIPRYSSGLPDEKLLGFGDVCTRCRGDSSAGLVAGEEPCGPLLRTITVRRRFSSGCHRKQGTLTLPVTGEDLALSCEKVKAACLEQFGWPVARLLVAAQDAEGGEVELTGEEVVNSAVTLVTVEKDESATPAEREGAAFEGSIFRCRAVAQAT